ncbi:MULTISPECIES: enoyl-CoA hydratase/isomerase family protein [Burkholderia cepacia complex]|uniref:enoyl-CoA hydratase/isomerase family protein n=1 Tax=Burkholderia cepacia complex TaxID=87882 RepID=UPI001CF22883|nr:MULTISPECIES: enoyl-CoA hydratase/isomerase family protein [Burkholderia cepacia complex]MCA8057405.1 enoyl-CoA hydratase/isomerase family protein [Burkholderia cepacia]MDN7535261.1 enoyl-CoA hydratase/isomerase family protein [Burkholderia orbicola]
MSEVMQPTNQSATDPSVLLKIINRVAVIKLNRPNSLNALSHDMVVLLSATLYRCRTDDEIVAVVIHGAGEKAFCAGGDVTEIYERARSRDRKWLQFFVDEYRLDYAIHRFPKPVIALIDGVTMGGGMGICQGAWLRVTTERTKIAMAETRIGMVPDVGATYFMAKMPVEMQLYLTLSGRPLNGADAVLCNLADVCVPSAWLVDFEARIRALLPSALDSALPDQLKRNLRQVFDAPGTQVPPSQLRPVFPLVNRYFRPRATVEDVIRSLKDELDKCTAQDARSWMVQTLSRLEQHSPTMLFVTREAMLRGRHSALADCFRMELAIVSRVIEEGDFVEGVRAHLVDKDHKPKWAPASVWEVRAERVQHFLKCPWPSNDHPLRDIERLHP